MEDQDDKKIVETPAEENKPVAQADGDAGAEQPVEEEKTGAPV